METISLVAILCFFSVFKVFSQNPEPDTLVEGMIFNYDFRPVEAAHIINTNNHRICISDSAGRFRIYGSRDDQLMIKTLAYKDTSIILSSPSMTYILFLSRKKYAIKELKVYQWGSSYEDFKRAFLAMPMQESLQEKLNLPFPEKDALPFDLDEESIKSLGFALSSPVSYLYYNLSKTEKSKRKVYQLTQTRDKRIAFHELLSRDNLNLLTGLKGDSLDEFRIYLYENLASDYQSSELDILDEIMKKFYVWKNKFP